MSEKMSLKKRVHLMKQSDMQYWLPKLYLKTLVPMPMTVIISTKDRDFHEVLKLVKDGVDHIGGAPVFIRTGFVSAKHDYTRTCYYDGTDKLGQHLHDLYEWSECADQPITCVAVRQFIPLNAQFKAFRGLPIAPERRYFIKYGRVVCHHPYWPEDAIRFYSNTPEPANWREMLKSMNAESPGEVQLLTQCAKELARYLRGYWSVDFAQHADGHWYFIDAARAELSWHPEHKED